MRIGIFISSFNVGGAEKAMINLSNALIQRNFDVSLCVLKSEGTLINQLSKSVKVVEINKKLSSSIPKVCKHIKHSKYDIIVSTQKHVSVGVFLALKTVRPGLRPKHIIRVATTLSADEKAANGFLSKSLNFLFYFSLRHSDHVIAVSNGVRSDIINFLNFRAYKVTTIFTPFITKAFLSKKEEETLINTTKHKTTIAAMGRVMPVKGFNILLSAFAKVAMKRDSIHLYIIGDHTRDEKEFKKLKDIILVHELEDKVTFTGLLSNPFPLLKKADIFVLSSLYEGMPGSLVQAGACGCKLVSTNCESGPKEIITSDRFGRLVPVEDVDAMAKAIEELILFPERVTSPDLSYFKEEYSINKHIDLFKKVLKEH